MAEAFDINKYALSLELTLNTTKAFKSLGELETKLNTMEEQVSKAAKAAFDQIDTSIEGICTKTTELGKLLQNAFTTVTQTVPKLDKLHKDLEKDVKSHELIEKSVRNRSKDEEKALKQLPVVAKHLQNEVQTTEQVGANLHKMIKIIDDKNQGHQEQVNLLKDTDAAAGASLLTLGGMASAVGNIGGFVKGLVSNWLGLKPILYSIANEELERVHTANFRVYGGMVDLNNMAHGLAAKYHFLGKEALEATESLMTLRYPREELERTSVAIMSASRSTGVGIPVLAKFAKNLQSVGSGAGNVEKRLAWMADEMRKSGLDAKQVEAIFAHQAMTANEAAGAWGDPKHLEKVIALDMQIKALGISMGKLPEDSQGISDMFKKLKPGLEAVMLGGRAGLRRAVAGADEYRAALTGVGKEAQAIFERTKANSVADQMSRAQQLKVLEKQSGINQAGLKFAADYYALLQHGDKAAQDFANGTTQIDKAMDGAKTQAELAAEASANGFRSLQTAEAAVETGVIGIKNALDGTVQKVGDTIYGLAAKFDENILPKLKEFKKSFQDTWTDIKVYSKATFETVMSFVQPFVDAVGGWPNAIIVAGAALLGAIGLWKLGSMGIGSAMGRVGQSGVRNAPGILSVSVAILAIAGAGYILALAVEKIHGQWGTLLALGGVLGGLTITIGAVGYAADGAIPGILAISVGMLAMGVAAVLVGEGMHRAEGAIKAVGETVSNIFKAIPETIKALGGAIAEAAVGIGDGIARPIRAMGTTVRKVIDAVGRNFQRGLEAWRNFAIQMSSADQAGQLANFEEAMRKCGKGIHALVGELGWFESPSFIAVGAGFSSMGAGMQSIAQYTPAAVDQVGKLAEVLKLVKIAAVGVSSGQPAFDGAVNVLVSFSQRLQKEVVPALYDVFVKISTAFGTLIAPVNKVNESMVLMGTVFEQTVVAVDGLLRDLLVFTDRAPQMSAAARQVSTDLIQVCKDAAAASKAAQSVNTDTKPAATQAATQAAATVVQQVQTQQAAVKTAVATTAAATTAASHQTVAATNVVKGGLVEMLNGFINAGTSGASALDKLTKKVGTDGQQMAKDLGVTVPQMDLLKNQVKTIDTKPIQNLAASQQQVTQTAQQQQQVTKTQTQVQQHATAALVQHVTAQKAVSREAQLMANQAGVLHKAHESARWARASQEQKDLWTAGTNKVFAIRSTEMQMTKLQEQFAHTRNQHERRHLQHQYRGLLHHRHQQYHQLHGLQQQWYRQEQHLSKQQRLNAQVGADAMQDTAIEQQKYMQQAQSTYTGENAVKGMENTAKGMQDATNALKAADPAGVAEDQYAQTSKAVDRLSNTNQKTQDQYKDMAEAQTVATVQVKHTDGTTRAASSAEILAAQYNVLTEILGKMTELAGGAGLKEVKELLSNSVDHLESMAGGGGKVNLASDLNDWGR